VIGIKIINTFTVLKNHIRMETNNTAVIPPEKERDSRFKTLDMANILVIGVRIWSGW